jgi:hypothetical protein
MIKLVEKQANALKDILENFVIFDKSGFGKIYNIILMTNKYFEGSIFIRFEQSNSLAPREEYDFIILEIKKDGTFEQIQKNFKNVYERYAFLGECVPFEQKDILIDTNLI